MVRVPAWVELVVGSLLCSQRFFSGYCGFPHYSKTLSNSNSTRNRVDGKPPCECASPKSLFIYLFIYLFTFLMISSQQSTYQAVLLTNGTDSYVIYSYEDGGMEWTRRIGRKCAVGYATKDRSYSYEEEDSFRESIFSIDTKEFEVNGVRRQGFFCKSLNAPDAPVVLTDEQKCMSWYNQEPDPKDWLEELGDCPATRTACRRDNRYRRETRSWSIECYELRFATPKYGASHRCCYHRRGRRRNAFVGEPPSAGRAYRLVFL